MNTKTESGSAIIWIMIAVFLFAALGFAMMRGGDTGTSMISSERETALARQIVGEGNALQQAAKRISLLGTIDTAISFQNNIDTDYTNAACGVAKCKVFDPAGGGLGWSILPKDANGGQSWLFTTNRMAGVGTAGTDLMGLVPNVKLGICNQINKMVGFGPAGGPPPQEANTIDLTKFTGTYGAVDMDDTAAVFEGKLQGCFQGGGTPPTTSYYYFQVLLPR